MKFCMVFLGPLVRWQKYFKTFFGMPGYLPDMGFLILRIFLVHVGAMHPHTLIFLIQYDTVFGQLQEKEKGVLRILAVLMWPLRPPVYQDARGWAATKATRVLTVVCRYSGLR